jgi:Fur family ferric uptake transcriptional regulator
MGTSAAEGWVSSAEQQLADAGYRRGGARAAVLGQLAEQDCALSAHDIEAQLKATDRAVGRASIYRVLEELHELGLVTRVEVGLDKALYERADADHHHHHLVCKECGAVLPFHDDDLEAAIGRLSSRLDFTVTEHDIVLRGVCAECS